MLVELTEDLKKQIVGDVRYVIFNMRHKTYYSDEYGWTTLDVATRFNELDKIVYHLLNEDCIWMKVE
jgi:hypothetical protein